MSKEYKILYSEERLKALAKLLAPRYCAANWEWVSCGIPSEKDIELEFRRLYSSAMETRIKYHEDYGWGKCCTGGLFSEIKGSEWFIGVKPEGYEGKLLFTDNDWNKWLKQLLKVEPKPRRMIQI